jgi:hypothetical protein
MNGKLLIEEEICTKEDLIFLVLKCLTSIWWKILETKKLISNPNWIHFEINKFKCSWSLEQVESTVSSLNLVQSQKVIVIYILLKWKLLLHQKNVPSFNWPVIECFVSKLNSFFHIVKCEIDVFNKFLNLIIWGTLNRYVVGVLAF